MFTQGFSEELERPDDFHVEGREGEAAGTSSRSGSWQHLSAKGGPKLAGGHEAKRCARGTATRRRR